AVQGAAAFADPAFRLAAGTEPRPRNALADAFPAFSARLQSRHLRGIWLSSAAIAGRGFEAQIGARTGGFRAQVSFLGRRHACLATRGAWRLLRSMLPRPRAKRRGFCP